MRSVALLDYGNCRLWLGVLMGLGTGIGDAVKSFFKRQIGIAPGASWIGFDQLDFFVGSYAFASVLFAPAPLATPLGAGERVHNRHSPASASMAALELVVDKISRARARPAARWG